MSVIISSGNGIPAAIDKPFENSIIINILKCLTCQRKYFRGAGINLFFFSHGTFPFNEN